MWERSKKETLNFLKIGIQDKLQSWKFKALNNVGKEVLIKVVVIAIPTYAMSILKLPTPWYSDTNAFIADFWWGYSQTGKKIH